MDTATTSVATDLRWPEPDLDAWRSLAAKALRRSGALAEDAPDDAVDAALESVTADGIHVAGLATAATAPEGWPPAAWLGRPPDERGTAVPWRVRSLVEEADPDEARRVAMDELDQGASSLWLRCGPGAVAPDEVASVLAGVEVDLADVVVDGGPQAAASWAAALVERYPGGAGAAGPVRGGLGVDPVGDAARSGERVDVAEVLAAGCDLAATCVRELPDVHAFTVDGTVHHEAGATDVDELGAVLATAVEYLGAMTAAGADTAAGMSQIELRLAATADVFLTLAKFRAARLAWHRVATACGLAAAPPARLHAVTSAVQLTRRDPWTNILRGTTAAVGAGLGGADAVTVMPFDAALGRPSGHARRLARVTSQTVLLESHLDVVADPALGSWHLDRLTDDLARAAWQRMRELAAAGGVARCLGDGSLAERYAGSVERRRGALAEGRQVIVGVTRFAVPDEHPPERQPRTVPAGRGPGALPVVRWEDLA